VIRDFVSTDSSWCDNHSGWDGQRSQKPENAEVTDIVGLPEKFKIQIQRRGLKKKEKAAAP
jgi:hypothetical protein